MAKDEGNPFATLLIVGAVAAGAAFIVSTSYDFSKDRIAANERARLLESLNSVLEPGVRDRDLNTVRLSATDAELLGDEAAVDVFVAIDGGEPVATIFASVAPHGYNAAIRLLIGVDGLGTLTGVRVVSHRETPGLGDRIDVAKSSWIRQFDGTSLRMPPVELWAVNREEEGAFDALTGATVTSRAVVGAVKNTLLYFEQHRDELYAAAKQTLQADDATPE
jgi:electron transport complex protein RnfG